MATERTSTPNGTGPLTVHSAQAQIASLLSADEDGGTQAGGETEPGDEPEDGEVPEGHELPEGETPEGGEDPESETEEEGDGESQELPEDARVVIDGQEVTLHELKRGFLREQDYTRKTQALARERQEFETTSQAELNALRTERAQYAQALGQMQVQMQALTPKEPDWNELYARDPAEYAAQRELWRSWQEGLHRLHAQQQALAEQAQADAAEQVKRQVQAEKGKLLEKLPEWQKPEVAKAEKQKLLAAGTDYGFSPEEVAGIVDHRAILVLRDAMRYREMQQRKQTLRATPSKNGPKPAVPGTAGKAPGRATDLTRSKQRLAKTGKVRDAAAVIENLLD